MWIEIPRTWIVTSLIAFSPTTHGQQILHETGRQFWRSMTQQRQRRKGELINDKVDTIALLGNKSIYLFFPIVNNIVENHLKSRSCVLIKYSEWKKSKKKFFSSAVLSLFLFSFLVVNRDVDASIPAQEERQWKRRLKLKVFKFWYTVRCHTVTQQCMSPANYKWRYWVSYCDW